MKRKINNFLFVVIILGLIINYLKKLLLYFPTFPITDKYIRFFQRLRHLTKDQNLVKSFNLCTEDNIMLDTVFVRNNNSDKCFILFGGHNGNISMRFDIIKFYYSYASVIIFDYRGYGKSTGDIKNIQEHSLLLDAECIWKYTTEELKFKPNNILLVGQSLGSSIATKLASDLSKTCDSNLYPHSLILNSPLCSLSSIINNIFRKINIEFIGNIVSFFFGNEYNTSKHLFYLNHRTNIIIAHSPKDETIPYSEALQLYDQALANEKKAKFINITGTHNNLGLTDEYIYAIAELFD